MCNFIIISVVMDIRVEVANKIMCILLSNCTFQIVSMSDGTFFGNLQIGRM